MYAGLKLWSKILIEETTYIYNAMKTTIQSDCIYTCLSQKLHKNLSQYLHKIQIKIKM